MKFFFNLIIIETTILILFVLNRFVFNNNDTHGDDPYNPLFLYSDNHKRIKLTEANDEKLMLNKFDCTSKTLVECNMTNDLACIGCNQILAACIHFETNTTLYDPNNKEIAEIPKNRSKQNGYCLRLTADKHSERKCTQKNGGKWILTKTNNNDNNNSDQYSYTCHCTSPHLFTKSSMYGDCDVFVGCTNSTILNKNSWSSFSEIECKCNDGYHIEEDSGIISLLSKRMASRQHITCIRDNIFHSKFPQHNDATIDPMYIEPTYSGYRNGIFLPNPCKFDAITGEYIGDNGEIHMHNYIAHCRAKSENGYTTVIFEDDYLINNGGKYANAVVRVASKSPLEINTIVYETSTRRRQKDGGTLYPPFVGHRYAITDLLIKLPYLDWDSTNMGGSGLTYKFAAQIPIDRHNKAKIIVYQAEIPEQVQMILGSVMSFVPVFVTYEWLGKEKRFLGTIPTININYMCGRLHASQISYEHAWDEREFNTRMSIGPIGNHDIHDTKTWRRYMYMPLVCSVKDENFDDILYVETYSKHFTGIIETCIHEDNKKNSYQIYTKPISPGSTALITKYRFQFDKNWKDLPESFAGITVFDRAFPIPSATNTLYGVNSHGNDCDGHTMPPAKYAHYTCSDDEFKWRTDYQ